MGYVEVKCCGWKRWCIDERGFRLVIYSVFEIDKWPVRSTVPPYLLCIHTNADHGHPFPVRVHVQPWIILIYSVWSLPQLCAISMDECPLPLRVRGQSWSFISTVIAFLFVFISVMHHSYGWMLRVRVQRYLDDSLLPLRAHVQPCIICIDDWLFALRVHMVLFFLTLFKFNAWFRIYDCSLPLRVHIQSKIIFIYDEYLLPLLVHVQPSSFVSMTCSPPAMNHNSYPHVYSTWIEYLPRSLLLGRLLISDLVHGGNEGSWELVSGNLSVDLSTRRLGSGVGSGSE